MPASYAGASWSATLDFISSRVAPLAAALFTPVTRSVR
jgi:hypothetical protein